MGDRVIDCGMDIENTARLAWRRPGDCAAMAGDLLAGDLWVFGYGSLMWRPGFEWVERRMARLEGWRRSFCLRSIHYRGTPEAPGLVLGLDAGPDAACDGVAYRVPDDARAATLAYLRERELVSYAYHERTAPVRLDGGAQAEALIYVVDRDHAQYAGVLSAREQAAIIARSVGPMGPNRDYLRQTVEHLAALGVRDPELETLEALVRAAQA